ncbi:Ubiquitin-60S ribosomal protein L40 [Thelohanellus kitauei]|uniref:Ubiquitin-ribosomal protein eL40 fusion protein n=1 Tax=Thelohanellus kitauei TaxID=669202 RepID=A0A0C2J0W2_THEKT|nr:Ubiquitin-60S ribosomal protein L40 [Thelohanellus kitauei]
MQLLIRGLDGRTKVQTVDCNSTFDTVLDSYCSSQGLPSESLRLIHGGKFLIMDRSLKSYGIDDTATIQLTSVLNGGIIEPSMRVLATDVNCNKKVCRKCYARLPARAENCRKRKCGHCADIRPKKMPK